MVDLQALSYNDYYPFGMLVPNRNYQSPSYRYGFQGQEKDDEVKGSGNSLNYKYRMHDPRVGRFFAVDPLAAKYPFYSPYSFSGNRVIDMVELEGLEPSSPGEKEGEERVADEKGTSSIHLHGGEIPRRWKWHAGEKQSDGTMTGAKWYLKSEYDKLVIPLALEFAQAVGWKIAFEWEEAGRLLTENKPLHPRLMSEAFRDFVGSRTFTDNYFSSLLKKGKSIIHKINYAKYMQATGLCTPMGFDSPFFMFAGSFKSLFAVKASNVGLKSFNKLDDLAKVFKGRTLSNSSSDLLKSGWIKLEGNWGTRTVYEKIIGNKRYYAQWETNAVHSIDNQAVSYWKLTYGKINATSSNTIRVSTSSRFINN